MTSPARVPGQSAGREPDQPTVPVGDVAFVLGRDVNGTHILRRRSAEAPVEAGVLRPLREGKPIDGEVVTLTPRSEGPLLFDVKSELPDPRAPRPAGDGPAQVATDAYRKGWEAIWGGRGRPSQPLN